MPINHRLLILAAGLLLAGCGTGGSLVKVPEKVYITVEKYVTPPAELLKDCHIEEPTELTVMEAVRVAKARKTALQKCNEDKAKLRQLGEKK